MLSVFLTLIIGMPAIYPNLIGRYVFPMCSQLISFLGNASLPHSVYIKIKSTGSVVLLPKIVAT